MSTATSTLVYLDCQCEDERTDDLALHATSIAGFWNGWAIPVVTAAEFARFVAAWRRNDPNGMWGDSGIQPAVREGDGALLFDDGEGGEPQVWTVTGRTHAGVPLYALDGWTWCL